MTAPTKATFHRSSPSGAAFGPGVGPNFFQWDHASHAGDQSRASSFGSITEGGRRMSTVGHFGEFQLGDERLLEGIIGGIGQLEENKDMSLISARRPQLLSVPLQLLVEG